jgi:hypothetical protein
MSQLVNFIPRTTEQCRQLLIDLRDNRDGIAIADRYGRIDALNASEIKALIELIENQIGEKTPEKAPAPSKEQIQKTVEKSVEKALKQTIKKSSKK